MKRKTERKINQQRSIMGVLDSHPAFWRDIPGFKKSYDQYVRNFKGIEDCVAELNMDSKSLDEKLERSRRELIEVIFPVISVLNIYARDAGDKKLGNLTDLKYNDLEVMNKKALSNTSMKILKNLEKLSHKKVPAEGKDQKKVKKRNGRYKIDINDYGISSERITKLNDQLKDFQEKLKESIKFQSARAVSLKKLDELIKENKRIRKQKLDKFVTLYRSSDKKFFGDYQNAKIIKSDNQQGKNDAGKNVSGKS